MFVSLKLYFDERPMFLVLHFDFIRSSLIFAIRVLINFTRQLLHILYFFTNYSSISLYTSFFVRTFARKLSFLAHQCVFAALSYSLRRRISAKLSAWIISARQLVLTYSFVYIMCELLFISLKMRLRHGIGICRKMSIIVFKYDALFKTYTDAFIPCLLSYELLFALLSPRFFALLRCNRHNLNWNAHGCAQTVSIIARIFVRIV